MFYKIFKVLLPRGDMHFDYYLSDVTRIFRGYGLDFWSGDWEKRKIVRSVIPVLLLSFYVFEAFYVFKYYDDFDLRLHSLIPAGPSALYIVKFVMIFIKRKELKYLINKVRYEFWNFDLDVDGNGESLKRKYLLKGSQIM